MNHDTWVNFYKPATMRSTQAVALVKRFYKAKKAGHAGTLDPLADGVLPIALNGATKQVNTIMNTSKEYFFTLTFGQQTETDDAQGQIIAFSDKRPSLQDVQKILPMFCGDIMQVPPQYSAIKIDGVRCYAMARKGREMQLSPRPVTIFQLSLADDAEIANLNAVRATLSMEDDFIPLASNKQHDVLEKLTLKALVSKGTYIRSLARDIGLQLGCYAYVSTLVRTQVGQFSIKNCINVIK